VTTTSYDRRVRFRISAVAVLGIAGLLSGGAAALGADSASSLPSGATAFAQAVLSEATVPPGGQLTSGIHTVEANWLAGWGPTPGTADIVGAHAFYLDDEARASVVHYIETHLPRGAILSGYGTANGLVTEVTETVALSGPDEYLAMLTYQVAPTNDTGTRSELRIDAKTVWVPPVRSPSTARETTSFGSRVIRRCQ